MPQIFRSRLFLGGLLGGMLSCAAFNLQSYNQLSTDCADCYFEVGWPFAAYVEGTILHLSDVWWPGLVANIAAAWFLSAGVGLTAHLLFGPRGERGYDTERG